jgi:hypothetical protein
VLQGRAASGTRQPQEFTSAAPLKFNGLSGVHRTVRCNSGATTISAPTATYDSLNARAARAEVRHAHACAPDTQQYMSSAPPDIQAGQKTELQWSEPNGFGDVAVAPDMSGAPSNRQPHQTASLVIGAINTPNHPPFNPSKFSTSQLLTRALAFNSRHTKEIKSSPNSTQRPSE